MSELLENIADFLKRERDHSSADSPLSDRPHANALAAAVLLVELARQDQDYGIEERQIIAQLVRERFDLTPKDAAALAARAETVEHAADDNFEYRQTIRQNFTETERLSIIEMLWRVAFADGVLMPLEADLIHRIGGSIGLSETQINNANPARLR
ncbi:MAG: TerB family tellurite resistance protein [Alphaproteobacteria bacterium]